MEIIRMRRIVAASLAAALVAGALASSPTIAVGGETLIGYQRIHVQGTYTISRDFSRTNACASNSGLDWRVRLQAQISYSGGQTITVKSAKIIFYMGDATASPQWIVVHGNPSTNYYRSQSGTVWADQTKAYYYNSNSGNGWSPLRAQGEGYVNEAFYVGFPHPDVGCLYDLYFVFYV
jgi:hypothetical protein